MLQNFEPIASTIAEACHDIERRGPTDKSVAIASAKKQTHLYVVVQVFNEEVHREVYHVVRQLNANIVQ